MDLPQAIGLQHNITAVMLAAFEIIWDSIIIQGSIWEEGDIFQIGLKNTY